jgi:hypothetical protein
METQFGSRLSVLEITSLVRKELVFEREEFDQVIDDADINNTLIESVRQAMVEKYIDLEVPRQSLGSAVGATYILGDRRTLIWYHRSSPSHYSHHPLVLNFPEARGDLLMT